MQSYRFSLGLLELASGAVLLILALCMASVQTFDIYPPLGFLPSFLATPLLFWLVTVVQERLPEDADLATYSYSRPATLVALGIFVFLPVVQFLLLPGAQSGGPVYIAAMVSGGIILVAGTGPRVAYLVGGTLLLGLALARYGPPAYATVIFCVVIGLILIPTGTMTLRRELLR